MRLALALFLALVSLPVFASGPDGRVIKVLPLFLDTNGVDAISPSLFDRDAYQAHLRNHPAEVSALRVDILWTAQPATNEQVSLRAELRGVSTNALPTATTLETNLMLTTSRHWTSLKIGGTDYKNIGTLVAWRVTLWDGDTMLGEQKSYLW
jgi:hypothetical protein